MTLSSPVAAQDFDKGLAAAQAGDYATALQEWTPLAESGNVIAQYNLGIMYDSGRGVILDYKEAVKWYRFAAERGNANAQHNLGIMYYNGQGVIEDYKESVRWLKLSAKQGNSAAHYNLGSSYKDGKGVLQDNTKAHMWFNIGAANGLWRSGERRDKIAKEMTSEDISKAQAMASKCMESNYEECGY